MRKTIFMKDQTSRKERLNFKLYITKETENAQSKSKRVKFIWRSDLSMGKRMGSARIAKGRLFALSRMEPRLV